MSLNTAVIYGSARRARKGINVARFAARKLEEHQHEVTLIDTAEYELPLLDLMYKEYDAGTAPAAMQAVGEILATADGFVIVTGEYMLYIHPDECIDCTLCIPECPVDAIYAEDDLPEEFQHFLELNAELTKEWPVITEMKPAPADAAEWEKKTDKLQYLER